MNQDQQPAPIIPRPSPASQIALGKIIFLSRWLQAPLYVGLILAQLVYVYHFMVELFHLFQHAATIEETEIMLTVLGLIDVVMIANLLIMVIVGGYETFVSRLNLEGHPDQPEWLSHVNAGVLKVKLATALIGISSIHLLKTFIEIGHITGATGHGGDHGAAAESAAEIAQAAAQAAVAYQEKMMAIAWQVIIHITFLGSALALAITDKIATPTHQHHSGSGTPGG